MPTRQYDEEVDLVDNNTINEGRASKSNLKITRVRMALPTKTEEEEGGGERPRIVRATTCGRSGEEPFKRNPENLAVWPVRPHETEEMEDDSEESWHDASEDGWEMAYEEVEDGAVVKREKMRAGAEGSGIGSRPGRGPNRTTFRFGWRAIRIWIVRQGRGSA